MTGLPTTRKTTAAGWLVALAGWSAACGVWLWCRSDPRPDPAAAAPPAATGALPDSGRPVEPAGGEAGAEVGAGLGLAARPGSGWEAAFNRWERESGAADGLVAFCLLDPTGEVVFASGLATRPLCPASALKILTGAAALRILGPEFRFETRLESAGPIQPDGTLAGDLTVVGGGDPTLAVRDLDRMADELVAAGMRSIAGSLAADLGRFPAAGVNDHWNWGDVGNAYGTGAYALNVGYNRLSVTFRAGAEVGAPATVVGTSPAWEALRWDNSVLTAAAGTGDRVMAYAAPGSRELRFRGTVPLGEERFTVGAALPDPAGFVLDRLRERLAAAGVKIRAGPAPTPASGTPPVALARHRSPPLEQIVARFHRVSDNLEAQCVFLELGHQTGNDPAEAIRRHWQEAGVEFRGLRLLDGSGLARANMIRALDLARVAHVAAAGPHGEAFVAGLPTAGGGMIRRKPGAMTGVRTEVGFFSPAAGRRWAYCLMANGLESPGDFRPWRDRWLQTALGHLAGER